MFVLLRVIISIRRELNSDKRFHHFSVCVYLFISVIDGI